MKILQICDSDYAAHAFRLMEAINKTTGHKAQHIRMVTHRFGYPCGIQTRDRAVAQKWIEWADVVNTHVSFRPLRMGGGPAMRPKHLIITHRGSHYRSHHKKLNEHARRHAKKQLCTTADLTKFGPTWIPNPIPIDRYRKFRKEPKGKPIVCQTPSNPKRKNSKEIEAALGGRGDIRLRIVYNTPHEEILKIIGQAHISICRFRLGLGMSGLEAMAMGIPVIANANPEDERLIIKEVGYIPYYKASLKELAEAVDALLDPKTYREWVERGDEYMRTFHDYPVVAKRYIRICEEVMAA